MEGGSKPSLAWMGDDPVQARQAEIVRETLLLPLAPNLLVTKPSPRFLPRSCFPPCRPPCPLFARPRVPSDARARAGHQAAAAARSPLCGPVRFPNIVVHLSSSDPHSAQLVAMIADGAPVGVPVSGGGSRCSAQTSGFAFSGCTGL